MSGAVRRFLLLFIVLLPSCSAQTQYSVRTDTTAQAYPGTIPCPAPSCSGGGSLTGANTTITPTDFNLPITRITDNSTSSTSDSFAWGQTGGAFVSPLNFNDDRMILQNGGNQSVPFRWNAATRTATKLYGAAYVVVPNPFSDMAWSYTQPYIGYSVGYNNDGSGNPRIFSWDFTSTSVAPTAVAVVDLSTCVAALAGTGFQTSGEIMVSQDDQTFFVNIGVSAAQTMRYAIVWNRTNGCRVWNTGTGAVTGAWGTTGNVSPLETFTIHSSQLSQDGAWLLMTYATCLSSCTPTVWKNYLWQVSGLTITPVTQNADCGHYTMGYTHWANSCDFSSSYNSSVYYRIPFTDPNNAGNPPLYVLNANVTPDQTGDDHPSWGSANSADTSPFCSSRTTTGAPLAPTVAYANEIICVATNGSGKVWRFAHNFTTQLGASFASTIALGSVSMDGKWFVWTSDWAGMLGNTSGASNTCIAGTNCRNDVFIMALPQPITASKPVMLMADEYDAEQVLPGSVAAQQGRLP